MTISTLKESLKKLRVPGGAEAIVNRNLELEDELKDRNGRFSVSRLLELYLNQNILAGEICFIIPALPFAQRTPLLTG